MVERKLARCFPVIVQYTWIANNCVTNTQTTHQYPLTYEAKKLKCLTLNLLLLKLFSSQ